MNYFFTCLPKVREKALKGRCYSAAPIKIGGVPGIIVSFEERDVALEIVGKGVAQQLPTVEEGTYVLLLEGQKPEIVEKIVRPFRVTANSMDSSGSSYFALSDLKRIAEERLLPVLKQDVEVIRYGGYSYGTKNDGVFRVHIWCSAVGTHSDGTAIRTRTIFGFDTMRDDWMWFAPAYRGVILSDPESGSPVAEIIGNDVYIFPPIAISENRNGLKIFRRILEEVVAELSLSPVQKVERERQRAEAERVRLQREHAEARIQYISLCRQRLQQVVDEARKRVSEGAQALQETQATIVVTTRELIGCKRKLEQLRKLKEEEDQRFAAEFDKICGLPQVEDVLMRDGNVLHVMTKTLTFKDPSNGTVYELGKYRIEIPVNGGNVRWINLTRQVDGLETGMQSPVVDANGCTILINAIQAFPELIANYEIAQAVQLALQVPGAIDPSEEHAKHLGNWPVASAA